MSNENTNTNPNAMSWNDLFISGSLVDIEISRWRARTKIKAADLGIGDSAEVAKALSLGQHRLAPTKAFEALNLIAGQAARTLEHHSLHFAMIKGARYTPHAQLSTMLGKLRAYKKEWIEATNTFMSTYEQTKAEMLPVIEKALRDAARNPEAAAVAYDRIVAEYPSSSEVREKFSFKWNVYAVQSPKSKAAGDVIQEESESIKSVVRGMIEQLRGEVGDKLKTLTELIGKGGKVPKQSLESARTLITRIEAMNVMGDSTLTEQTQALGRFINALEDEAQNPVVAMGLAEIQKTLETSIEQAVLDAENRLTSVGRRKIEMAPAAPLVEPAAPVEVPVEVSPALPKATTEDDAIGLIS